MTSFYFLMSTEAQMTPAKNTNWFFDPLDLYFNEPYMTADLDDY